MKITQRFVLVLSSVALLAILLTSLLLNQTVQKSFQQYVVNRQDQAIRLIADNVTRDLNQAGGFTESSLSWLAHQAMMDEYHIIIADINDQYIWQSPIPVHMASTPEEQWEEVHIGLFLGERLRAKLIVHYRAAGYFWSNLDVDFVRSLYKDLLLSGLLTVAASLIISYLLGRSMATPLVNMTEVTNQLKLGDLSQRLKLVGRKDEIGELAQSINHLAQSLEDQENLRRTLTADVAHELRTPLATLQSHIEAFMDQVWQPDAKRMAVCNAEVQRLKKLVNDLESLSSAELRISYDMTELNFTDLVQNAVDAMLPKAQEKSQAIDFSVQEPIYSTGDANRLTQLTINLLDNAVKYTPENGKIEVKLEKILYPQPLIILRVCDTGPGVAPEDVANIFERYYRGDKSRTRLTGGSGIGLAIVKAVAQAHGGRAEVESTSSQGSVFKVTLPLNIPD